MQRPVSRACWRTLVAVVKYKEGFETYTSKSRMRRQQMCQLRFFRVSAQSARLSSKKVLLHLLARPPSCSQTPWSCSLLPIDAAQESSGTTVFRLLYSKPCLKSFSLAIMPTFDPVYIPQFSADRTRSPTPKVLIEIARESADFESSIHYVGADSGQSC